MHVILNGQKTDAPADGSLPKLLEQLQLGERRYAVELNGDIVPRSQIATTVVRDGDRVEVVHAIGGG